MREEYKVMIAVWFFVSIWIAIVIFIVAPSPFWKFLCHSARDTSSRSAGALRATSQMIAVQKPTPRVRAARHWSRNTSVISRPYADRKVPG